MSDQKPDKGLLPLQYSRRSVLLLSHRYIHQQQLILGLLRQAPLKMLLISWIRRGTLFS